MGHNEVPRCKFIAISAYKTIRKTSYSHLMAHIKALAQKEEITPLK